MPAPARTGQPACLARGVDPDAYWPDADHAPPDDALDACQACPVRRGCLATGLREPEGWFGGLSPASRRRLRVVPDRLPPVERPTRPAAIAAAEAAAGIVPLSLDLATALAVRDLARQVGGVRKACRQLGTNHTSAYRAWRHYGIPFPGRRRTA